MGGLVCLSGMGQKWAEGLALRQENLGFLREAETQRKAILHLGQ